MRKRVRVSGSPGWPTTKEAGGPGVSSGGVGVGLWWRSDTIIVVMGCCWSDTSVAKDPATAPLLFAHKNATSTHVVQSRVKQFEGAAGNSTGGGATRGKSAANNHSVARGNAVKPAAAQPKRPYFASAVSSNAPSSSSSFSSSTSTTTSLSFSSTGARAPPLRGAVKTVHSSTNSKGATTNRQQQQTQKPPSQLKQRLQAESQRQKDSRQRVQQRMQQKLEQKRLQK